MSFISKIFSCDWGDDDWVPPSQRAPGDRYDMFPGNYGEMRSVLRGLPMATKFEETQLLRASLPNDKTWRPINKVNIEVSEGQAVIIYGRCHMNPQFSHAGEMFFSSEVHVMDGTKKLAEPVQGSGFDMYNSQKSKDCVFGVWKATVTGTVQLRYMARAGSSISGGKVLLTENKCTLGAVVI